jgi:hypothetical protein
MRGVFVASKFPCVSSFTHVFAVPPAAPPPATPRPPRPACHATPLPESPGFRPYMLLGLDLAGSQQPQAEWLLWQRGRTRNGSWQMV